jgi:dipeptidyl aminopeptidase/acylaminoacyl peptidase
MVALRPICIVLGVLLGLGTLTGTAVGQGPGEVQANWLADGSSFWFADGEGDDLTIYLVDPTQNERSALFDVSRLRLALSEAFGKEPPPGRLPFETLSIVDQDEGIFELRVGDDFLHIRLDDYELSPAPSRPTDVEAEVLPRVVKQWRWSWPDLMETRSPDGRWLLGLDGHDLQVRSTADGEAIRLTTDGVDGKEWLLGFEQGAGSGVFSPNGNSVAVIRTDVRQVPRIPIQYYLGSAQEVEWLQSSTPGDPAPEFELFVIDVPSGKRVRADLDGDPGDKIDIAGWRTDGSEVLFHRRSRTGGSVELLAISPSTGATRSILKEEGQADFVTWVGEDGRFIWSSERDGWGHLYLYDLGGELIRQLTEGAFPVLAGAHAWIPQSGLVSVDEAEGWIYVRAQGDSERPYDVHLYRARLDQGGMERLTQEAGFHDIQFSPSKEFFLDTYSTVDRPPVTELRRVDGSHLQTLSAVVAEMPGDVGRPHPEEFVVKAADGITDLYGALFLPPDFDPSETYPVIEWIYAGPWTTVTPRRFNDATASEARWLADLGAVVFIVDGRGTPGRGREFQNVVLGSLGRHEIPDHVAALRQLAAERPYMDTSRVGVLGGSWGGYFALRAMLLAPDTYHVGVAFAPAGDLADYWADYVVPYLGLPENDPEAYEFGSNSALAANLGGALLLIHGTGDAEAPFSGTMNMAAALIQAGKDFDLVVLPDENHYILWGPNSGYLRERIQRHFEEHLGL